MEGERRRWRILLPLGLLFAASVACGGFQVRVTPTPGAAAAGTARPVATTVITPTAEAIVETPVPTAVPTAAPGAGGASNLAVGVKARVAAAVLNVRSEPKTDGQKVGQLEAGAIITLKGGPVQADNFTWWQIDNGSGVTGWAASGPPNAPWFEAQGPAPAPSTGGPKLVNRQIKVGDKVQVTTKDTQQLTVRATAGTGAEAVAHVLAGQQFTVKAGPTNQDGLVWWQIQSDKVTGWAAEGDGQDRWLTPLE